MRFGGIITRFLAKLTNEPATNGPADDPWIFVQWGDVPFVPVELRCATRGNIGGREAASGSAPRIGTGGDIARHHGEGI